MYERASKPVTAVIAIATLFIYVVVALQGRVSVGTFATAVAPVQVVAASTQSSLATLPAMIECARERLHVSPRIASLVLPLAVVLPAFRVWLPGALAAAGLVILFAVGSTVAFDSEHPRFTSVSYRLAADGGTRWETIDRNDDYTRAFLGAHPQGRPVPEYYPHLGPRLTLGAPAPDYGLRPPRLSLLSDAVVGDRRTVRVRVRPGRDAAVVSLVVHTVVGRLSASVHGHELGGADTALLDGSTVRWSFDYHAPPPEGIVVTLRFAAGRSDMRRVGDGSDRLGIGHHAQAREQKAEGEATCRCGRVRRVGLGAVSGIHGESNAAQVECITRRTTGARQGAEGRFL